jgi:phage gpG-like protein
MNQKKKKMNQIKESIDKVVNDLASIYTDLSPILIEVAAVIDAAISDNFAEQGRYDGTGTDIFSGGNKKWDALAESTKKQYRKKGYTLEPTLWRGGSNRLNVAVNIVGNTIAVGSNLKYAAVHQFGYDKKNIPARPFVTLTEQDLEDILMKFTKYLQ